MPREEQKLKKVQSVLLEDVVVKPQFITMFDDVMVKFRDSLTNISSFLVRSIVLG